MGFLKKVFGAKEVIIDPADLLIPDVVGTDAPGITLKKAPIGQPVEIEIVGESFNAKNIEAVSKVAQGKEFNIYLVAEPTNQYDKKAVAVYAATVKVGYIAKPENTQWFKRVNEALKQKQLLWGTGRAVSRPGTENTGIFGSIYMPKVGRDVDELIPQKMTDAAIKKAIEKVISFANTCVEPETVTQLKSLCKKAMTISSPFAAHAKWVEENHDSQDLEKWNEVMAACDDIFDDFSDSAYATDEMEVDIVGRIESLAKLVREIQPK